MIFLTKGEFIQALKDYNQLKDNLDILKVILDKKNYLRFNKVSSPLDYDVVEYKGNEAIRSLKSHSYISESAKLSMQENLDNEIKRLEELIDELNAKLIYTMDVLHTFDDLTESILIDKYLVGMSYQSLTKKYQKNFEEKIYPMFLKRYINSKLDDMFIMYD